MSLFDKQSSSFVTLEEAFPNATPFIVVWATYDGEIDTSFGSRPRATLHVLPSRPTAEYSPTEYFVWGPPAAQIEAAEEAELPARLVYVKGKPNRLDPAEEPITSEQREALLKMRPASALPF